MMILKRLSFGMEDRYLNALKEYEAVIAKNVCENLFDRHIKRLFMTDQYPAGLKRYLKLSVS